MIIATPDGKHYEKFWFDKDSFEKEHLQEITQKYAKYQCKTTPAYIKFRKLTLTERISIIKQPVIDVTWE